jgi:hypothetical protein
VIKIAQNCPWLLALLTVGAILSATALAVSDRPQLASSRTIAAGTLEESAPEPDAAKVPTIRDPLLSSVLLPLPPLLLPDLLLPGYNFPSFNSQRLDEELQIYSRYLRIYGAPDVLIVGSSRSLQGIDPTVLQTSLATQGYPDAKVFNFGVNGATAQVIDLVVRQVLHQEQLPKLIIWGDGLRAFNDGRADLTYREIVASPGYQQLQAGQRPIPDRVFAQDTASLNASIDPVVANSLLADSTQQISSVLNMYGFQAIADRFDPASYYQHYPRVPGNYDADYVPFGLGGEQTQATIALAQYARAQAIPLVIVNLPLTVDYMDGPRSQYEQRFRQHMQQLSEQEQFKFVDLVQHPNLIQNQYFADPSHINQLGAAAVAQQLAAEPTIPWTAIK